MAAYYKVDVSLSTNSVTVGAPSPQEVIVTLPLVGPAGAVGATGATGATGPAGSGIEILTTQGDLLYRGASDGQRLPIGTSGQVLKVSGGIPAWGAESGAVSSVAGRTGAITLAVADVANAVATSDSRLSDSRTPLSHTHGNLTNAGAIGTTANLPVKTGTSGVIEAGAFGTSAGQFAEGNDSRFVAASTTTPAALGTAAVGTGTTFARADHVHAMPTAANVGAAQAVTEIEVATFGTVTTTLTTAQLPARVILFLSSDGPTANVTINLPTPSIRQSGLTVAIKVDYEDGSEQSAFVTVVGSTTLLSAYELGLGEGDLLFRWDGVAWVWSRRAAAGALYDDVLSVSALSASDATLTLNNTTAPLYLAYDGITATRNIAFPDASGTIALTSQLATGSTDNAVLRADGTGGSTLQASNLTISDDIREFTFSGVGSTDVITATGHNFTTNQLVRVRGLSGGSGLFAINYFVRDLSGDTFKLSRTSGGSVDNFNDCTGIIVAVHPTVAIVNASAGVNSSLLLTPKGDAGLILGPTPDGTTVGGDLRGTYSVDLQILRNASSQVAASAHSIVLAGQRNTASNNQAIAGGFASTASGNTSVALGSSCTASGNIAVAMGSSCTASGAQTVALGDSALADRFGLLAHASGSFSAAGDAQRFSAILRCKTTTNSAVEMALNGTTTYLTIPSGKVIFCNIKVVGVKSDGAVVATYERQYAAKNVAGTSSEVFAPVTIGTDNASSTSLEVATVDAGDYIRIRPTGITSEIWRWVASVDAVEVAYGT
jgi:hypothetical protein